MPVHLKLKKHNDIGEAYLKEALNIVDPKKITKIADNCVEEFAKASPTEELARSWNYEIISKNNKLSLFFTNSLTKNGENLAIIIDIGHGTPDGRWVAGKKYLAEPIKKSYDQIIKNTWEALKSYERS